MRVVTLPDALRFANAFLALALVMACVWAIFVSGYWDQRVRFGLFAAFGVLLAGGHLSSLTEPFNWRLPTLTLVVLAALVSTLLFVRRGLRTDHAP